jgi:DNA-binding SARP family transcriptional activator
MAPLKICLFGKFSAQQNHEELDGLHSGKVKELLCYLLLHRDRAHSREVLASHLWDECTTALSKKYLRQALWQLHQSLQGAEHSGVYRALQADTECVRLSTSQELALDVAEFERGFGKAQGVAGEHLDEETARSLREAVALYQGELLEGCYQDWCLYHRERLQNMYVAMLDKLMVHCELHRDFAGGLAFGERLLREDAARERTYVQLMRMEYLAGDRAGALRRYQRCVAALKKELDVEPAKRTLELYEQIRADQLQVSGPPQGQNPAGPTENQVLPPLLNRLRRIRSLLLGMQDRVQQDIQAIDNALSIRNTRR